MHVYVNIIEASSFRGATPSGEGCVHVFVYFCVCAATLVGLITWDITGPPIHPLTPTYIHEHVHKH